MYSTMQEDKLLRNSVVIVTTYLFYNFFKRAECQALLVTFFKNCYLHYTSQLGILTYGAIRISFKICCVCWACNHMFPFFHDTGTPPITLFSESQKTTLKEECLYHVIVRLTEIIKDLLKALVP